MGLGSCNQSNALELRMSILQISTATPGASKSDFCSSLRQSLLLPSPGKSFTEPENYKTTNLEAPRYTSKGFEKEMRAEAARGSAPRITLGKAKAMTEISTSV